MAKKNKPEQLISNELTFRLCLRVVIILWIVWDETWQRALFLAVAIWLIMMVFDYFFDKAFGKFDGKK